MLAKSLAFLVSFAAISTAASASELVTNGTFSLGNTGFSSGYTFGSVAPEGGYVIGINPATATGHYADAASFGDHTTGSGQMLIANGSSVPNTAVWSQLVNLIAGTSYVASFFAANVNLINASPSQLQFYVDSIPIGDVLTTTTAGTFLLGGGNYFASGGGPVTLSIVNLNTAGGWNDFAIDDISFFSSNVSAVPEPATWMMMIAGFGLIGAVMRRRATQARVALA